MLKRTQKKSRRNTEDFMNKHYLTIKALEGFLEGHKELFGHLTGLSRALMPPK
jgi:hypothetical protein